MHPTFVAHSGHRRRRLAVDDCLAASRRWSAAQLASCRDCASVRELLGRRSLAGLGGSGTGAKAACRWGSRKRSLAISALATSTRLHGHRALLVRSRVAQDSSSPTIGAIDVVTRPRIRRHRHLCGAEQLIAAVRGATLLALDAAAQESLAFRRQQVDLAAENVMMNQRKVRIVRQITAIVRA